MKQTNKFIWGIIILTIGVILGLNALEITNINLFFKGWWTLFIIVPSFIGLFEKDDFTGNFISLVIGIVLLLTTRGIIDFNLVFKLVVPFVLVMVGLSLMFNDLLKRKVTTKVKEFSKTDYETITATFSGQKIVKDDEDFKFANLDSVFGGITLDLRNAKITDEAVIKASSIFSGITIILPQDVNVKVKSTPIFGGVSNNIANNKNNQKTIYIDAFCLFGGVDLK